MFAISCQPKSVLKAFSPRKLTCEELVPRSYVVVVVRTEPFLRGRRVSLSYVVCLCLRLQFVLRASLDSYYTGTCTYNSNDHNTQHATNARISLRTVLLPILRYQRNTTIAINLPTQP